MHQGILLFGLCCVCACSKREAPAAQPVASAIAAAASATPNAAPPDPGYLVDLMFVDGQLYSCDEIAGAPDKLHETAERFRAELAKHKTSDEVLIEGKTCIEAAPGHVWQAVCQRKDVATAYYDAKEMKGSDAHFKACVEKGGTWKVNDSDEAKRDALERQINSPEHQALRRRAIDAVNQE